MTVSLLGNVFSEGLSRWKKERVVRDGAGGEEYFKFDKSLPQPEDHWLEGIGPHICES